jgi:16S rRNA processing protein RimM
VPIARGAEAPPAMTRGPDRIVVMGEVVGPYGVRGWLKVRTFTESPTALLDFAEWWLKPKRSSVWNEFSRLEGRLHSGSLVVALRGVDTREAALAMKGFEVGVPRLALPVVRDEIYWEDLKGLAVFNRTGVLLGEVRGVVEHGAHPLLRVALPGQAMPERLIPYVPAIVDRIDVEAGRIEVDWEADF